MTPAFHLLLPFRRRTRTSSIIGVFALAGMLGWAFFVFDPDLLSGVDLTVVGLLYFVLVAREAIPLLRPGISRGEGLTMDSAGLTLSRDGNATQWRWDEVYDVRLRGRFHPARLIHGRFVTFRAPKDGRRRIVNSWKERLFALGRYVVIADDYPSRADDIFRQIEHYRTSSTAGMRPPRPLDPLWSYRKDRVDKEPKFWRIAPHFLGSFLSVVVVKALVGDLPATVEEFLESPLLIGFGIGFGAILPWMIMVQYRWEARQDNMIAASAGGLATADKIQRRLWLWRDILDMRVRQPSSHGEDGFTTRILSFRATHDGTDPGMEPKQGKPLFPVSCAIEDLYETPIEEIARQARAWWDWSSETFGSPEFSIVGTAAGEGNIAFRPMTGDVEWPASPLDLVLSLAIVAPMLVWAGVLVGMARADIRPADWLHLSGPLHSIGNIVITIAPLIMGCLALMAHPLNRLELDETGLLSVCYARKRRWAWHELGAAEVRRVRGKWPLKQRAVLTIEAPANGIGSAFLRWAFNIDNRRLAVIEDIYDSPLDEIADAMNSRRRMQDRMKR